MGKTTKLLLAAYIPIAIFSLLLPEYNTSFLGEVGLNVISTVSASGVEIVEFVSSKCFFPRPKVNSAIVKLKINDRL